jgi:hypothetical protein
VAGREVDSQQDTQKKSQSKADIQAAGIQQQVYRQQSGKTDRQACSQVVGWRVADSQKVSRHSGRQEAGRPA